MFIARFLDAEGDGIANPVLFVREDPKMGDLTWTLIPASRQGYINNRRKGKLLYRREED